MRTSTRTLVVAVLTAVASLLVVLQPATAQAATYKKHCKYVYKGSPNESYNAAAG